MRFVSRVQYIFDWVIRIQNSGEFNILTFDFLMTFVSRVQYILDWVIRIQNSGKFNILTPDS